jgi:hypothetical protein
MRRINKQFYMLSFIILGVLTLIMLFITVGIDDEEAPAIFVIPIFIMYVFALVFHYNAWKAIQDERTEISPSKAIGFLFIPGYNLFWLFKTLYGYAQEHNAYVSRQKIETKDLPELLYFYQCVLLLVTSFLFNFESDGAIFAAMIGLVWLYVNTLIIINKSSNAVNTIYKTRETETVSDA